MDLGGTIAQLRKSKKIKQKTLAEKCDISTVYLSLIENNKKEPNLAVLKKISSKIGIPLPIIFFLSLDDDDVPDEKRETFAFLSPPVKALISEIFLSSPK